MTSELGEELKQFERDLASLVARFLRLYERVEANVRPAQRPTPPQPAGLTPAPAPRAEPTPTLLPGYQ